MKTSGKPLFIALFAIFSLTSFSTLIDKTYYWDAYNISFTVPNDFKAVKNTKNELDLVGDGMELYMYVWNQKRVTTEEMHDATISVAKEMKLQEVDEEEPFKNGAFEGYYVEGFKDGDRVMLAGVVDIQSRTNFFIAITFDDKDAEAEETALHILESISHK
jgi:hypothetical protein